MLEEFLKGRIVVKVGDITLESVDAIVNAANSTLLGGGGVDGAIHARGGPMILEECKAIRATSHPNGLAAGGAVITTGGDLSAKHVIHTVGPIYGMNDGNDAELLRDSYLSSLALAVEHSLESMAFPSISTGAFGYPKHEAAAVASTALSGFLANHHLPIDVRLVFFSESDAKIFIKHASF